MTDQPAITDEAVNTFRRARLVHANSCQAPPNLRRVGDCCTRAGLAAAAPHIAAQSLRLLEQLASTTETYVLGRSGEPLPHGELATARAALCDALNDAWLHLRPSSGRGHPGPSPATHTTPCAVCGSFPMAAAPCVECGEQAGVDPDEEHDEPATRTPSATLRATDEVLG